MWIRILTDRRIWDVYNNNILDSIDEPKQYTRKGKTQDVQSNRGSRRLKWSMKYVVVQMDCGDERFSSKMNVGRDETDDIKGMYDLLEHMFFKGQRVSHIQTIRTDIYLWR